MGPLRSKRKQPKACGRQIAKKASPPADIGSRDSLCFPSFICWFKALLLSSSFHSLKLPACPLHHPFFLWVLCDFIMLLKNKSKVGVVKGGFCGNQRKVSLQNPGTGALYWEECLLSPPVESIYFLLESLPCQTKQPWWRDWEEREEANRGRDGCSKKWKGSLQSSREGSEILQKAATGTPNTL